MKLEETTYFLLKNLVGKMSIKIKKENINKALESLEVKGYYVFQNKLDDQICERMINIINHNKRKKDLKSNFHQSGSNMIYNLYNKDEIFLNLIFEKNFLAICEKYFKVGSHRNDTYNYQFELMHSRILKDKSKAQKLHIDSRLCGVYPPTSIHFFIYLNDVQKGSGPTQLVPSSHKKKRYPTYLDQKKAIKIFGKKGTIIALNSSLWHGSSIKTSIGERIILTLAYSRWFIRQQFAIPYSIDEKIEKKLSKKQKMILGYSNYAAVSEHERLRSRGKLPNYIKKK